MSRLADLSSLSVSHGWKGAIFRVKVQPRATRDELGGILDGMLKIRLTSPPVKGAANTRCIKLLACKLGVNKGRISILRGAQTKEKLVQVKGLTPQQVLAALAESWEIYKF